MFGPLHRERYNEESGPEFYSVVIYRNKSHSEVRDFGIGICSQGLGLKPHLLLLPEKGTLILGFNDEAVGVSLETDQVCFKISFGPSPFFSFIHLSELKMILALHEIGVITINEDGEKLWEYDGGDVITSAEVVGEGLHLEFMDSPAVTLKLIHGTEFDPVE